MLRALVVEGRLEYLPIFWVTSLRLETVQSHQQETQARDPPTEPLEQRRMRLSHENIAHKRNHALEKK